ncbi:MAG TPA: hypothetical protein VKS60_07305 [Stellaceae bacterium]|nr:hypothetical protein [Stellaceae bacterium]
MTCTNETRSNRHLSLKLSAGLAIAALLALGTVAVPASADDHRGGDHRGGDYRGGHGYGGWNGGVYVAPPVVYGSPYYSPYYNPPPVVYGPDIGIVVPGVSIGIR